jgi:hypothetical protein
MSRCPAFPISLRVPQPALSEPFRRVERVSSVVKGSGSRSRAMTAIPAISATRPPPCSFVSFVVKDFGFAQTEKIPETVCLAQLS